MLVPKQPPLKLKPEKYVAVLARKTIDAVTAMLAVMKIVQNRINAVPVMPVKMY